MFTPAIPSSPLRNDPLLARHLASYEMCAAYFELVTTFGNPFEIIAAIANIDKSWIGYPHMYSNWRGFLKKYLEEAGLIDHHLIYKLDFTHAAKPFLMAANRYALIHPSWHPDPRLSFSVYFSHWLVAHSSGTLHYDPVVMSEYKHHFPLTKNVNGKYLQRGCTHVWNKEKKPL